MRNRKNKMNKIEYSSRVQMKKNKNSSSHGASAWAHLGRRCWAHQPGLPQHRGWVAHLGGGASGLWAAALCASGRIGVGARSPSPAVALASVVVGGCGISSSGGVMMAWRSRGGRGISSSGGGRGIHARTERGGEQRKVIGD
jgi:hypothetical protein